MRARIALVSAVALAAAALDVVPLAAQQPPAVVIRNVSVIPMDREEVLAGQTVVIRDGRIASVGAAAAQVPAGATEVDGTGRFLIPGLAEMHAHVSSGQAAANNATRPPASETRAPRP